MSRGLTVGIDVGTTNVKAALVELGPAPRVVARASADHPTLRPAPGRAEQSPQAWWAATCSALAGLGDGVCAAAAVSVSGQGSTVTLCGPAGEEASPAIGWQDTRAAADAAMLDRALRADLDRAHGNDTGDAPEPKLRWLLRETSDVTGRADRAVTAAAWIQARLGGEATITEADAGAWMSWNRHERRWDAPLASALGVGRLLPPVGPAGAAAGRVSAAAARATGLPEGAALVLGTSDVAAAAVSAGVGRPGEVAYSKGTGGFACCYVAPLVDPGPLLALPAIGPEAVQLCGASNTVGAAWDWVRALTGCADHTEAERLAEAAGDGGPLFLPWLAGAAQPLVNQHALAAFAQLSLQTGRDALLRAVLDGTAAALGEQLTAAREVSGHDFGLVVSTGGPTRSALWNRLDAAAAGAPVAVAPVSDAAVGGALIAAQAAGLVESAVECGRALREGAPVFEPEPDLVARAERLASELAPVREMALALAGGTGARG